MGGRHLLFWLFAKIYRLSHWLRSRFSMTGRTLLALMLAAGALGLDTRQNVLYQAFALLGATLFVAIASSLWFRPRFSVRRSLPAFATVGQSLSYQLRISSESARIQRDLLVRDELRGGRVDTEHYRSYKPADEDTRNWFDRQVGYPRWAWLMGRQTGARIEPQPVPDLPARGTVNVRCSLTPLRRGYLDFRIARIGRPDPLGLYTAFADYPVPARLLVLPRRYPVGSLTLPGHRRYQPGGVQLASQVGDSQEFIGLRDYRPGDPRKHIHWRSWARSGRPTVKQFQDEYFVRQALVLDTWSQRSDIFEASVSAAASIVGSELGADVLLDLMFAGSRVVHLTEGRGLAGADQLLEALACVQSGDQQAFDRLCMQVQRHRALLSGCILILQDWDAPRRRLVRQLKAQQVPLLVIRMHAPGEQPAARPGSAAEQPERLIDLDAGRLQEGLARL